MGKQKNQEERNKKETESLRFHQDKKWKNRPERGLCEEDPPLRRFA